LRRRYLLDAGVLALYFAGREDVRIYVDSAYSGAAEVYMCEVNLAEFLYNYARVFGWSIALSRHSFIRSSPIRIVGVDEELTVEAARLKLKYYNVLSLADCYLIALGKRLRARVVTTDSRVRDVGEVSTEFVKL